MSRVIRNTIILLFGLLCYAAQSADKPLKLPVPGKVVDNDSQKTDIEKNASKTKEKIAPPSVKVETPSDKQKADKPAHKGNRPTERSEISATNKPVEIAPIDVRSINVGPLSVNKDPADYALIVLTLALLIVGYFQFKASHAAAAAAKASAEAADRQGRILVAVERPWVISRNPDRPEGWPPKPRDGESWTIRFNWSITNVGNSPAFLTYLYVKPRLVDVPPPEPKYDDSQFPQFVIPPGGDHASKSWIPDISFEDIQKLKAGNKVILLYGKLIYESRLGTAHNHTTRFCHVWGYKDGGDFYSPVGPESYIDYT